MKLRSVFTLLALLLPFVFTSSACSKKTDETNGARFIHVIDNDRGWLGVSIDDVTPRLVKKKNLKVEEGAYVTNVAEGSPAETAGVKEGDVILEFDGMRITDSDDLINEVRDRKPGTKLPIVIMRDGERKNIDIVIEELPRRRSFSLRIPRTPRSHSAPHFAFRFNTGLYGLTLEEISHQLGEYFGAPMGKGILVMNVQRDSEGEKAGFRAGDVILKIGKENIKDLDDVWSALDNYNTGDKADVEVLRKGVTQTLTLTIEEHGRELGFRHLKSADDIIMDFMPYEEGKRLRKEAEQLKRDLEHMRHSLREDMLELKYKLRRETDRVRRSINS